MTASIATNMNSVCKTRTALLDQLAGLLVHLGRAKSNLCCAMEDGDAAKCKSAECEIEQLWTDCGAVRFELEYHRVQHGC